MTHILLTIGIGWAWSWLILWRLTAPTIPVRQWNRRQRLLFAVAPYTLLRWGFNRLKWACRIRTTIRPPKPARFQNEPSGYRGDWAEYQRTKISDGDWFVRGGRRFEVVWISVGFDTWHGEVRALDGEMVDLGTNPDEPVMFDCHEYRRITMFDVHDGTYTPYIPPEIATILQSATS